MKFTTTLAVVLTAAATFNGVAAETNAERLARGLPPNPPAKRWTPTSAAKRGQPSGSPNQCNTGPIQCCNKVTTARDSTAGLIMSLLGIVTSLDTVVGLTCSPISVLGIGGNSCHAQPVCCSNNNFNGLIALGCSPSE
ncbi:hypothetical protein AX16_007125 [Volvariella volvacea WC 439]|nr:hypothetical protein AX16_007125 [Volvariella volvacea WC 439]